MIVFERLLAFLAEQLVQVPAWKLGAFFWGLLAAVVRLALR